MFSKYSYQCEKHSYLNVTYGQTDRRTTSRGVTALLQRSIAR